MPTKDEVKELSILGLLLYIKQITKITTDTTEEITEQKRLLYEAYDLIMEKLPEPIKAKDGKIEMKESNAPETDLREALEYLQTKVSLFARIELIGEDFPAEKIKNLLKTHLGTPFTGPKEGGWKKLNKKQIKTKAAY